MPLVRLFQSEENRNYFEKQIIKNNIGNYCQILELEQLYQKFGVESTFGGLETHFSGYVDVKRFLEKSKSYFLKLEILNYIEEYIYDYESCDSELRVFCEGYRAMQNPHFKFIPFNPVKGEVLELDIPGFSLATILNRGKWIFQSNDCTFRAGSTYSWHELDHNPTDRGKSEILDSIQELIPSEYQIRGHKAGVRPSIKDRRPVLGVHPNHLGMYIFNGLGTKGVSLGPYFGSMMADFLTNAKDLNPEVNINRFL